MIPHVLAVLAGLELLADTAELRQLGLSDEEIDGYVEYFRDNYPELKTNEIHNKTQVLSNDL